MEVTIDDVVRDSARAAQIPGGSAALFFRLTDRGAKRFHDLTRALARRGARLGEPQAFLVALGEMTRNITVDYRASPDGLDGTQGIQIEGMTLAKANEAAIGIRDTG